MRNPFPINAQTHEYCGPNRFEEREKREEQIDQTMEDVESYLKDGIPPLNCLYELAWLRNINRSTVNNMIRWATERSLSADEKNTSGNDEKNQTLGA